MVDAYGKEGVFLLGISLVLFLAGLFCLVRPRGRRLDVGGRLTLGLMGITILPCLLQVYVLRQHSLQHSFSALKFSVPLSLIPFVALPVLIDRVLQGRLFALAKIPLALSTRRVGRAASISVAALVVVVTGALYVTMNHKRHYEYFPDPSPELMEIGYFVRDNTEYRDIVFSSSFEIPVEPPQQLSYSRKRVYQALTLDDIYRKVTPLDELDRDYTINLLVFKDDQDLSAGMRNLISKAHKTDRSGSLRLFKIEPEVFRSVILESDSELSLVSPQTNDEYSLVQSEDGIFGELIRGSTGEIIRIVAGAMDGAVDMVQQERGHTWLRGWVSDEAHRETADRVLVFVDGKSNHEKHGSFRRIDLAPSLKKAGFHVGLPQPVFEEDPAPVVRVFAVSPPGTASELWYQPEYYDGLQKHRLGKAARALRYSLGRSGDGFEESIVSKTGKTVRIVPGAMDGAVDALSQQREHTRVSGWASDGAHRTPADQVAVFVNGEADHYGYTVVRRPDLVEGFKTKSLLEAGLEVILPGLVFDREPSPTVRVFAISATGLASELQYRSEYADGSRTLRLGKH